MKTELVSTLKCKAADIISEITREHKPVLITQDGLPAAYLVDVESYEGMEKRLKLLEGIAKGERAIEEGRVVSHSEAVEKMSKWLD